MRCIVGLVLFLVLYFGSCKFLDVGVTAVTLQTGHAYSQREAQRAGAEAVRKYHALVAVGAGVATLLVCSAPTLLLRMSERDEDWQ